MIVQKLTEKRGMSRKNSPTTRSLELLKILKESPEGVTFKELADRFDMTERTIRRLLSAWSNAGLPIKESIEAHGRKRLYLDENPLVPAQFDFTEATALYLGYRFLAPMANSFLWKAARSGLRKIRDQLGTASVGLLDQLLETFHESTTGWSDYSQQSEVIETLIQACEEKKKAVIRYRSLTAEESQTYTIHPYELVSQTGTLYVVGFSCQRNEIRTWKMNRIVEAECLQTKFKKPKDFDVEVYRRRGFGIFVFNDEPVQRVRVRVDKWMARYVQEHHWHETQQFEQQPDGGVIVQFEVVPTRELTNWILKLGRHAEVLEPQSLRHEVETEIREMLRRYTNTEPQS